MDCAKIHWPQHRRQFREMATDTLKGLVARYNEMTASDLSIQENKVFVKLSHLFYQDGSTEKAGLYIVALGRKAEKITLPSEDDAHRQAMADTLYHALLGGDCHPPKLNYGNSHVINACRTLVMLYMSCKDLLKAVEATRKFAASYYKGWSQRVRKEGGRTAIISG